jgi:hypothetical protein
MLQNQLLIEPLEDLESPWDWQSFALGVGVGVALVALT